jgi:hypothetical protein
MRWIVNVTPRPIYPREKEPVPILQETFLDPWAGLEGREKTRPHWDSIPVNILFEVRTKLVYYLKEISVGRIKGTYFD